MSQDLHELSETIVRCDRQRSEALAIYTVTSPADEPRFEAAKEAYSLTWGYAVAVIRKIPPERRIMSAIASMPYRSTPSTSLAAAAGSSAPVPVTLELLADYLEGLVERLRDVKDVEEENESEISQIRSDFECARRVFRLVSGTEPLTFARKKD